MAHPNVAEARKAAGQAHADVVAQMRVVENKCNVYRPLNGQPIQPNKLADLEHALDDLKGKIVHLVNARTAVEFFEES